MGAAAKPHERSSSSVPEPPSSSPNPSPGQRDVGQGRPGPDLSQLLPLEWPDSVDAGKDGTEVHSLRDHLGQGLHSAPPHSGNLPQLARGSGCPGHLLWRPGAAAPNRRRNAKQLACGHAAYYEEVEVDHSQRPPSEGPQKGHPSAIRQDPVRRGTKGASWLPRVGTLRGGLEAM